jgi:hypothetical protein
MFPDSLPRIAAVIAKRHEKNCNSVSRIGVNDIDA